jgi:hypothetical protein
MLVSRAFTPHSPLRAARRPPASPILRVPGRTDRTSQPAPPFRGHVHRPLPPPREDRAALGREALEVETHLHGRCPRRARHRRSRSPDPHRWASRRNTVRFPASSAQPIQSGRSATAQASPANHREVPGRPPATVSKGADWGRGPSAEGDHERPLVVIAQFAPRRRCGWFDLVATRKIQGVAVGNLRFGCRCSRAARSLPSASRGGQMGVRARHGAVPLPRREAPARSAFASLLETGP